MSASKVSAAAEIEAAARQAAFVFLGTIQRLNAATMSAVPVSSNTAVVRVDDVYRAPAILGDLSGNEITAQLQDSQPMEEGQQAIFFADPWLYGDSIAVQEVDRRAAGAGASARVRQQVAAAVAGLPDAEMRQRVAEADVVVVGRVYNAQPAPGRGGGAVGMSALGVPEGHWVTEHDPQWWEASVAVESVEKGQLSQDTVTLVFPNSMDVMWFDAPKLHVGQEGVWFLRRGVAAAGAPDAYAALDRLDAHPKGEIERIRRMIQDIEGSPD